MPYFKETVRNFLLFKCLFICVSAFKSLERKTRFEKLWTVVKITYFLVYLKINTLDVCGKEFYEWLAKVTIYYTSGKCKRKSSSALYVFLGVTATNCSCSEWANQRLHWAWSWQGFPPLAALPLAYRKLSGLLADEFSSTN